MTENAPLYAVGDIHGRLDCLERLLSLIAEDLRDGPGEVVFLGDYIDRGPDSRQVIARLLDIETGARREPLNDRVSARFLKGNHEAALLTFLERPETGPDWMRWGGAETLVSYGVAPPRKQTDAAAWAEASEALREAVPAAHLDFLNALELCLDRNPYLLVHAGVDPAAPLFEQSESTLLTIRDRFLSASDPLDRVIVHGHTPELEPFQDHRRIGVDTGAYHTGRLTAARLDGGPVRFIST